MLFVEVVYYSIILAVVLSCIKLAAQYIESICWVHYSNVQKKEEFKVLLDMYDGDKECAIYELKSKFQGIDSELGAKKYEFLAKENTAEYIQQLNNNVSEYIKNARKQKPDYSLVKNKSQKAVKAWDYYFNYLVCHKELVASSDWQIKMIYYCRLTYTMIDMFLQPQQTGFQFLNIYLDSLKYAALKAANKRTKKVDLNTLPEETQKRLREAEEREAA